jgi:hypothetical protein
MRAEYSSHDLTLRGSDLNIQSHGNAGKVANKHRLLNRENIVDFQTFNILTEHSMQHIILVEAGTGPVCQLVNKKLH